MTGPCLSLHQDPRALRMTILPRITDKNRQADNRGARWLPITDTDLWGQDTRAQGRRRGRRASPGGQSC